VPEDDAPQETRVMTSFYPLYALALNLTQGVPALMLNNLVQPQAGCPRAYQLSDWDAALIGAQDAMIIGGRGLEAFESALGSSTSGPAVLIAMSGLTLYNNGAPSNEESSHLDGDNPWLFLSVGGAMDICTAIASGMAQMDEPYADIYLNNLSAYLQRLQNLADDMEHVIERAPSLPVAVLHEGLGYLARQLRLKVVCEYPREPGTEQYGNDLSDLLAALADAGAIAIAQLHGHEDADYIAELRKLTRIGIIQAFQVHGAADVEAAQESVAEMVLLDAGQGSGERFDWSLLRDFGRPYILAGGLTPANVADAIARLHPWGVDLSSGLETDKLKDPAQIQAAVAAVKGA
jgi:ABC-type Zn uptake system ZnuABC Zn-binding protein ZnuA